MDQSGMNMPVEYGQFVAENTIGVNHDHYFSYRLDMDVDGQANSFMANRMVQQLLPSDPMRKSIWAVKHRMKPGSRELSATGTESAHRRCREYRGAGPQRHLHPGARRRKQWPPLSPALPKQRQTHR
jgi:Cu2+-containing amine oxidase